ncbi:MAG: hypothetical protein HQ490_06965 [Lutibacter sp.]|nr:hypothetical protein [Lutibacter sp.]
MTFNIAISTADGFAPFIMGAHIASDVATYLQAQGRDIRIIMPHTHGNPQSRIINGELGLENLVILDKTLGNLYNSSSFVTSDFAKNMDYIVQNRKKVESVIQKHIETNYGTPDITISIGGRIIPKAKLITAYAYPQIVSELMGAVARDQGINGRFDVSTAKKAEEEMRKIEAEYDIACISSVHTFSYLKNERQPSHPNEILTPPLARIPGKSQIKVPKNSVFCMASGTGSEISSVAEKGLEYLRQGMTIYTTPAGIEAFGDQAPNVRVHRGLPDEIIASPNLERVIARAGWGTLWLCQQTDTNIEAVPYDPEKRGDDAEIYYNLRTLAAIDLMEATKQQRKEFPNMDGLAYVAKQIIEKAGI